MAEDWTQAGEALLAAEPETPQRTSAGDPDMSDDDIRSLPMNHGSGLFSLRPSPWVIYPMIVISACIHSATMAARAEILVKLVCAYYRPEYFYSKPAPTPGLFPAMTKIPSGNNQCSSDPTVLAAVATLSTALTLTLGVLTVLTTGWWGQLSDRRGRKFVLGFAIIGIILSDGGYIIVATSRARLPGDYWFLILTSFADGVFGGLSTASAATHAYVSDCTLPHERSRLFAFYLGFLFIGIAIGPAIGSLLIRLHNDLLIPYYCAFAVDILVALFLWFVLPESLSIEAMRRVAKKQSDSRRERREHIMRARMDGSWSIRHRLTEPLMTLFKPLGIFSPRARDVRDSRLGKDWSLIYLASAVGIMSTFYGLGAFNSQYAIAQFGWTAKELGYWLSAVGATRAFHLIVTTPIITRIFKPNPISLSRTPAHVDLWIALGSLVMDVLGYGVIAGSIGPKSWFAGSMLSCLGTTFGPSMQSLASLLTGSQENGKLFGGLAVVTAVGGQVIGPAIFGSIYVGTVDTFPRTMYLLAVALACAALACVSRIKIPTENLRDGMIVDVEREDDEI